MAEPVWTDEEKEMIKALQIERAKAGSDFILVHLGKTVLGQTEKHHHTLEALPFTQLTIEQIEERLAQRAAEAEKERLTQGLALAFLNPPSGLAQTEPDRLPEVPEGPFDGTSPVTAEPAKKARRKKAQ